MRVCELCCLARAVGADEAVAAAYGELDLRVFDELLAVGGECEAADLHIESARLRDEDAGAVAVRLLHLRLLGWGQRRKRRRRSRESSEEAEEEIEEVPAALALASYCFGFGFRGFALRWHNAERERSVGAGSAAKLKRASVRQGMRGEGE